MDSSNIIFNPSTADQYLLLHLTDDLLDQPLYIKPASSSATVLCTETSTYQLKDVQQSNSLMFLAETDSQGDLMIKGEAASWLEATKLQNPRINLAQLPIFRGRGSVNGMGRAVLFASIPVSDKQLQEALEEQLCLELNNGYVRLDSGYVTQTLRTMITSVLAEGLELDRLDIKAAVEALKDENEEQDVIKFLFQRFSLPIENDESNANEHRKIDSIEIVRFTGISTLELFAKGPISTTKFLALWSQSTPLQMQSFCKDLSILIGHYIQPVSSQIQHFSSTTLSMDAKQRINQLFAVKERWSVQEMSPYLEEITDGPKAIQSILMKHAKKTKIGQTTFVERRGK